MRIKYVLAFIEIWGHVGGYYCTTTVFDSFPCHVNSLIFHKNCNFIDKVLLVAGAEDATSLPYLQ